MASHARCESFDVLAPGHAGLPELTRYALSDTDQDITGNHTIPCIVYPFSGSKAELVQHLQQGLTNVLACIPIAGGELEAAADGSISVVRRNHEPVKLYVHYLDEADSPFPTYADLAVSGFPPAVFSANAARLTPPGSNLSGFRRDTGCPVSAFQVNFIRGGVILSVAMHHMVADASSIGHTIRLWAASARAAAAAGEMPVFAPVLDRTYFNAALTPLTWEETQAKKKHIRGYSFHPLAQKPSTEPLTEPPPLPPTEIAMYRFESAAVAALKKACWPGEGEGEGRFVSSYDVMCGLVWRCLTRARLPYLQQQKKDEDVRAATTSLVHPVNARGRVDAVSPAYFGNGFGMMATEPVNIGALVDGPDGLATAAQSIRRATQRFVDETIPDLMAVRRGIVGREEMRWIWLPENAMSTSWTGMRAMQDFDFGFGKPMAVRLPVPPFEGIMGVLPGSRLAGDAEAADEGAFDVYVVLEKGCQERLRADPEFGRYTTELGKP